jgi:hypothetical protein
LLFTYSPLDISQTKLNKIYNSSLCLKLFSILSIVRHSLPKEVNCTSYNHKQPHCLAGIYVTSRILYTPAVCLFYNHLNYELLCDSASPFSFFCRGGFSIWRRYISCAISCLIEPRWGEKDQGDVAPSYGAISYKLPTTVKSPRAPRHTLALFQKWASVFCSQVSIVQKVADPNPLS